MDVRRHNAALQPRNSDSCTGHSDAAGAASEAVVVFGHRNAVLNLQELFALRRVIDPMQQKTILSVAGLLIIAYYSWLLFGSGDWFFTHSKNAPSRVALIGIREEIKLGNDYEAILKSYWRQKSKDLTLHTGSPQIWTVSMPYELGATNWVLYIEFSEGRVSALRVRTSDGPAPSGAPVDVGG